MNTVQRPHVRPCGASSHRCFAATHSIHRKRSSSYSARTDTRLHAAVLGIDLGTTNSLIATFKDGQAVVLSDEHGRTSTPSVVSYTNDGSTLVGHAAVAAAQQHPSNTFYSVKRLIGRQFSEVQPFAEQLVYRVSEGRDGIAVLHCPSHKGALLPEQVSAEVLRHLLQQARQQLDDDISEAVVTVPAHFNAQQRAATLRAAAAAGLDRVSLLQEPVAAAMAYGFGKVYDYETILVFDLGGGTFDVSLLDCFDGILEVLDTAGDSALGGDDFDRAICKWALCASGAYSAAEAAAVAADAAAAAALLAAAEAAKQQLSQQQRVQLLLPAPPGSSSSRSAALSQQQLGEICLPLMQKMWPPLQQLAASTKLQYAWSPRHHIPQQQQQQQQQQQPPPPPHSSSEKYAAPPRKATAAVLVGGATRMPAVQDYVSKLTGLTPRSGVDPESAVALGAAIQAATFAGLSSGVELVDGSYVAQVHGRATGFQPAATASAPGWQP